MSSFEIISTEAPEYDPSKTTGDGMSKTSLVVEWSTKPSDNNCGNSRRCIHLIYTRYFTTRKAWEKFCFENLDGEAGAFRGQIIIQLCSASGHGVLGIGLNRRWARVSKSEATGIWTGRLRGWY